MQILFKVTFASLLSANSPVYSHLSMTLSGLTTVRAFKGQEFMYSQYCSHQDLHTTTYFLHISLERWLSICMESLQIILGIVVVWGSIFIDNCKYLVPFCTIFSLCLCHNWIMLRMVLLLNLVTFTREEIKVNLNSETKFNWETITLYLTVCSSFRPKMKVFALMQ